MKKIRIFGRASGPGGSFPAGGIMTVGKDLTIESAEHLVASRQAEWVEEAPAVVREEVVETAEAEPAPEAAVKRPRKPRRRKPAAKKA